SGNTRDGVFITLAGATGNAVKGNVIGLNTAVAALANGGGGVEIRDASANSVGGTTVADRNVIPGNRRNGVAITGSATRIARNVISTNGLAGILVSGATSGQNGISQNSIFDNGGLGIDLSNGTAPDGVTAN